MHDAAQRRYAAAGFQYGVHVRGIRDIALHDGNRCSPAAQAIERLFGCGRGSAAPGQRDVAGARGDERSSDLRPEPAEFGGTAASAIHTQQRRSIDSHAGGIETVTYVQPPGCMRIRGLLCLDIVKACIGILRYEGAENQSGWCCRFRAVAGTAQ